MMICTRHWSGITDLGVPYIQVPVAEEVEIKGELLVRLSKTSH